MTQARIFDPRSCFLGEGPLWHPERQQLFWFDIIHKRLRSRRDEAALEWQFEEHFSAAGRIDADTLLLASETGLWSFDIDSGRKERFLTLEADKPQTRSNDGRADPQGGFWIGTMGKQAERDAGAIHRYFEGRIETIFMGITIPNAICFAPDGRTAYFADTPTQKILRQPLDPEGWPEGAPELFLDLAPEGLYPDGAVVDAEGALWSAQWGAGRVARYLPDGQLERVVQLAGSQSTCPAFGGPDGETLFVTSAQEGLEHPDSAQGLVYCIETGIKGQQEHRVRMTR
ncbi:SMP-30/gluconolactonase/LRE family protein [Pseudooceanicola sp. CBS1P-1]|uniref:SMP-30/gluconolactonase/LRE family protein n=1 Tax=Pseudooceanicola albus TaxID=2692189 RepID=A0A6L7GA57_9RHOB|nr:MULTISPECIES: SMP-30/gluconolactonase/LRE family protein [Pseudooceanicola]MBT9382876.1 SMP-30/gluconolactonase/LRE family protein [Pseudooceanicola endophyticus]MXN20200.1 SMP-30/gluconolactonase/LRE family protein [Pseudooceanicola albus]